jgi:hypothetical protein
MSFSIAERPPLRRGELRVPKSPTTTCLQLYKHLFKQHRPGKKNTLFVSPYLSGPCYLTSTVMDQN